MKGGEYEKAFGRAPGSFKRRVAFALTHAEEAPKVKKYSMRLAVIAVVLLMVTAGAVYAATMEWGISDFAIRWHHKNPVSNMQKAILENGIHQTIEAGDFEISVKETVADGRIVYVSADIRMKNGEKAYLLPMEISPKKTMSEMMGRQWYTMWVFRPDFFGKRFQNADEMFSEDPPISQDTRTLRQAAQEEGKRLIGIGLWVKHGKEYGEITTFTMQQDGSVSFVLGGALATQEKEMDVELIFSAREVSLENLTFSQVDLHTFPLKLPVLRGAEKSVDVAGMQVEGMDIVLEQLDFYLTPLTLHYELRFFSPKDYKSLGKSFFIEFLNEKGKLIFPGMTIYLHTEKLDDTHFVQIGSLALDAFPDFLTLRGHISKPGTADRFPIGALHLD